MKNLLLLSLSVALIAAVAYWRMPATDGDRETAPRRPPIIAPNTTAEHRQLPERVELPTVSAALAHARRQLEKAVADDDLSPGESEQLIRNIARLLREDRRLAKEVIILFREAVRRHAELAAEILATAMGRVRYPELLREVMTAIDSLAMGEGALRQRLIAALMQSTGRRPGITTFVRFSVFDTSQVRERNVREWGLAKLAKLSEDGSARDQGSMEMLVLGLSRGPVDDRDARDVIESILRAPGGTRRGNLLDATHLTQNPLIRGALLEHLREHNWQSDYELRMTASALVKTAGLAAADSLAAMLLPGANTDRANAILEFLPQRPRPPAEQRSTALANQVVTIALSESRDWPLRTKLLAARALVGYVSDNGLVAGLTSRCLRQIAKGELPSAVLRELAAIGAHVTPDDLMPLEYALTAPAAPKNTRSALLAAFRTHNHRMQKAAREAFLDGLKQRHPSEIGPLLPASEAKGSVIGVVLDAERRRVASATVRLSASSSAGGHFEATTVTDSRGQFSFYDVANRRYDLTVSDRGGATGELKRTTPGPDLKLIVLGKK